MSTIELKKVRYHPGLGEDTDVFSATVYVDGQRVGDVGNDGCGGANWYAPASVEQHLKNSVVHGDADRMVCHAVMQHLRCNRGVSTLFGGSLA